MKDSSVYLRDIIERIERLQEYLDGMTESEFLASKLMRDAVERNLEVIGEAAGRVPEALRAQAPTIPWKRIVGLRNIVIHQYKGIDQAVIWDTASLKLPALKPSFEALLEIALSATP
ncbi:DUF86 domain-containing protein [bacterium]|nr:DUF86 domain-containing protein [bacterium]